MQQMPLKDALKIAFLNIIMQTSNTGLNSTNDVAIPYLRGKPGGGKTQSIAAMCQKMGFGFMSTHFAIKPIEETGGIPRFTKVTINGKEIPGTIWTIPDIFMYLYELSARYKDTVVVWLLDDAHLMTPYHMKLLYELFTERSLRGYKLPRNVGMIMAGNKGNKAGARALFSAIVNRVMVMDVETPFEDWKRDFAIPNNVNPIVVSFLSYEQNSARFFHEEEKMDEPWGSPRSWTRFANLLDALMAATKKRDIEEIISSEQNPNLARIFAEFVQTEGSTIKLTTPVIQYLCAGHVGDSAATEFAKYWEIYGMFNFDEEMKNFAKGDTSTFKELSKYHQYIFAMGLMNHYLGKILEKATTKDKRERKKFYNHAFAKFLITLFNEYEDLAMLVLRELRIHETELKRQFMNALLDEVYNIDKASMEKITKFFREIRDNIERR